MLRITKEDVIELRNEISKNSKVLSGIRDENLIDSAIGSAYQSFGGIDVYNDNISKISRIGLGLAKNHAFVDGNKRTALVVICTYLEYLGCSLTKKDIDTIAIKLLESVSSSVEWSEVLGEFIVGMKKLLNYNEALEEKKKRRKRKYHINPCAGNVEKNVDFFNLVMNGDTSNDSSLFASDGAFVGGESLVEDNNETNIVDGTVYIPVENLGRWTREFDVKELEANGGFVKVDGKKTTSWEECWPVLENGERYIEEENHHKTTIKGIKYVKVDCQLVVDDSGDITTEDFIKQSNDLYERELKETSNNDDDSLDIDFDEDDFDNYIEDEPPTEEQIEFSKEIKDLFQSIIDAEDGEDAIEEDFVSNSSLLRHFKKHCLGKSSVKKSTDDFIYYDFTNINQFSNYEQVITRKFQSNDVLIPNGMYNVKSVNDNFKKLFEGDKCFLFGPEWGFTNKNGNIRVGVYAYSSNVTTNYKGGNTVDIYISTSSPKTITLYPINAARLKDKLVTILIKYSNSNVVIDNDNENKFVK